MNIACTSNPWPNSRRSGSRLLRGGPPTAPVTQSCSTAGLNPAEVQEIQDLIARAS